MGGDRREIGVGDIFDEGIAGGPVVEDDFSAVIAFGKEPEHLIFFDDDDGTDVMDVHQTDRVVDGGIGWASPDSGRLGMEELEDRTVGVHDGRGLGLSNIAHKI